MSAWEDLPEDDEPDLDDTFDVGDLFDVDPEYLEHIESQGVNSDDWLEAYYEDRQNGGIE